MCLLPFLCPILGSLLRNRTVSPWWIRQTDTLRAVAAHATILAVFTTTRAFLRSFSLLPSSHRPPSPPPWRKEKPRPTRSGADELLARAESNGYEIGPPRGRLMALNSEVLSEIWRQGAIKKLPKWPHAAGAQTQDRVLGYTDMIGCRERARDKIS